MKCWMNCLRLYSSIQHQVSSIDGIFVPFIHKFLFTNSNYNRKLKMEAEQYLMLAVLSELMDSDDEKPTRGKARSWYLSSYLDNTQSKYKRYHYGDR